MTEGLTYIPRRPASEPPPLFDLFIGRLENLEGAHEFLVDGHHGSGIVDATVVGRREQRHQLTLGEELVTVINNHGEGKSFQDI